MDKLNITFLIYGSKLANVALAPAGLISMNSSK